MFFEKSLKATFSLLSFARHLMWETFSNKTRVTSSVSSTTFFSPAISVFTVILDF